MRKRRGIRVLSATAILMLAAGCNHSRYGVHHDQRLPEIKRVGVIVPSVKVYSLHTGGVSEQRPDLEPDVQSRTMALVEKEVQRCGREAVRVKIPATSSQPSTDAAVGRMALINAVSEAIVTHHYLYGKERTIDYVTGDAPAVLGSGSLDALLCVGVSGTVPTSGRNFLKGTAIAVGIVTGIHIKVPTKQATVAAMLLDNRTGEVLWFNAAMKEIKVTDEGDYRRLCEKACKYLLKPSK